MTIAFYNRLMAVFLCLLFFASPAQAKCYGLDATIQGNAANNVLDGSGGNDIIQGGGGADIIRGQGGSDLMCGGAGNDRINGNAGADRGTGDGGYDSCADPDQGPATYNCEERPNTPTNVAQASLMQSASVVYRLMYGVSVPTSELKKTQKLINKARIKLGN